MRDDECADIIADISDISSPVNKVVHKNRV